jgi:hypothetical protein
MPVLHDRMNILDVAKRTDPDGKFADIAEVLTEMCPIVADAPSIESNGPTGNRVTIRTALPRLFPARINQGQTRSKSRTRQRVDTIGGVDGLSELDARLAVAGADVNALRFDELQAFLESSKQTAESMLLYGDETVDDASCTGFMPRMAAVGPRVISGGSAVGQVDNTSMLIVDWHPRYVGMIHPPGHTAGLEHRNLGEIRSADGDGRPMQVLAEYIGWWFGLTIKNDRHVARICNIDVSDLALAGLSTYVGAELTLRTIDALNAMDPPNGAKRVIYAPQVVLTAWEKLILVKPNLALSWGEWYGEPVVEFRKIPVRRCDAFSLTEPRLV